MGIGVVSWWTRRGNGGGRREQNLRYNHVDNSSGLSGSRGSQASARNLQGKPATDCWYCGHKGHRESECWKKKVDSYKSGSSKTKHGNRQRSRYADGSEGTENGSGQVFVMKHKANLMAVNTSKPNEVWYVDFKVSNHMTSHKA